MPNLAYQYIDRPNGPSGHVYGAFLLYIDGETRVIHSPGNDIHRLWRYLGNGNMGIGKERLREFMQLPSFSLNPAQYNSMASQDDTSIPYVHGKGD